MLAVRSNVPVVVVSVLGAGADTQCAELPFDAHTGTHEGVVAFAKAAEFVVAAVDEGRRFQVLLQLRCRRQIKKGCVGRAVTMSAPADGFHVLKGQRALGTDLERTGRLGAVRHGASRNESGQPGDNPKRRPRDDICSRQNGPQCLRAAGVDGTRRRSAVPVITR